VGELRPNQVVKAMLTCPNENGTLRVLLEGGQWTSVSSGLRTFLQPVTRVDTNYICVSPKGVSVRASIIESSAVVAEIRLDQVVHAVMRCEMAKGGLRLQMDNGKWIPIHNGDESKPLMRLVENIDETYWCASEDGAQTSRGLGVTSQKDGARVKFGEVVRVDMRCVDAEGVMRLRLENGFWATTKRDVLHKVDLLDQDYVCVSSKGVKVRPEMVDDGNGGAGELQLGQVIHAPLVCFGKNGAVFARLAPGQWVTVHTGDLARAPLRPANVGEHHFTCIYPKGAFVYSGYPMSSTIVGEIARGQKVTGACLVENAYGDTRVKLGNGKWVSVNDTRDSRVFFEPCTPDA